MIPQCVKLKGFLCYKDEQEVDFDGNATLWMLSGLNGSGKSSIFDAVTYAPFGHHRGGAQQAHELSNKASDGFAGRGATLSVAPVGFVAACGSDGAWT